MKKARTVLPTKMLKLTYTALVRPHLEYCSLSFANASKTNLRKLEMVQRIASRIICGVNRDAHSGPLLETLGLISLKDRRERKIVKTVINIINNNCHPSLQNMFTTNADGLLSTVINNRTTFGKKRFNIYAIDIYNRMLSDISE